MRHCLSTFIGMPAFNLHILCARGGQPIARDLIGLNQTDLGAHLSTHVGHRHALLHRQRLHRFAAKLNSLILTAVHTKSTNHVQHHVLGGDARLKSVVPAH